MGGQGEGQKLEEIQLKDNFSEKLRCLSCVWMRGWRILPAHSGAELQPLQGDGIVESVYCSKNKFCFPNFSIWSVRAWGLWMELVFWRENSAASGNPQQQGKDVSPSREESAEGKQVCDRNNILHGSTFQISPLSPIQSLYFHFG